MVGKLKNLVFQAVLRMGKSPLAPVVSSAQHAMLFCDCRYSVPPEHGKRLERLAKGTMSPPCAGSDLPVGCAHCSKMSILCGQMLMCPFSGLCVGDELDCWIGYRSRAIKIGNFLHLSWEGTK